ncbi:hypothetical protein K438DRAFT_1625175, partial [Mycena galopus ATCC 62051]
PSITSISQCNTGDSRCCNYIRAANTVRTSLSVPYGLGCTPTTVVGIANGGVCTGQPVCYTNNNFNGLIGVGCAMISLIIRRDQGRCN